MHIKLHIVRTYIILILATQTINIFYHTYILLYYPQMHFIISQNKQDNSRLCTILDYNLTCSDHDERVVKVGPVMRITELEAKSKGKRCAASFFILSRVRRCPSPTVYW